MSAVDRAVRTIRRLSSLAIALVYSIPGARKVVIPNAGHGAHFAQPARFNAAVRHFLAESPRADRR